MASSPGSPPPRPLLLLLLLIIVVAFAPSAADANAVFKVRRKFAHRGATLADLRAHDGRRHGRLLSAFDLPLGGTGSPTMDGLYYAELAIGSPATTYHVQVDTGSDILWVNCYNCKNCPKKTNLGFDLKLYNPKQSNSASLVTCDSKFCAAAYGDKLESCTSGAACQYSLLYGDGSGTDGVFITDNIQLNLVSGNMQTAQGNATVNFGCGAQSSGELGSSDAAVDGIFGFGQSNTSVLSQLSASGIVKKMFAHCLDTKNGGGGIFAIGNVVQPKVQSTPLVPDQPHYNVNMKGIDVAGKFLALPTDLFDTSEKTGTIIDSGTTLAYLPDVALKALMDQVFINHQTLPLRQIQGFVCFPYTGDIDDGFPYITLHFESSVTLKVYPHDYLFEYESDIWCLGFQSSTSQSNDRNYFLLGDLVLSNKLVFYDLENQTIGWTDYNCSSTIKVRDDKTGAVYSVGSHNISSSTTLELGRVLFLLLLSSVLHHLLC